jgi:hypothetical protein
MGICPSRIIRLLTGKLGKSALLKLHDELVFVLQDLHLEELNDMWLLQLARVKKRLIYATYVIEVTEDFRSLVPQGHDIFEPRLDFDSFDSYVLAGIHINSFRNDLVQPGEDEFAADEAILRKTVILASGQR